MSELKALPSSLLLESLPQLQMEIIDLFFSNQVIHDLYAYMLPVAIQKILDGSWLAKGHH